MWCVSSWSTSAWWSPRSSRARRLRATTPAANSSRLRCGTQGVGRRARADRRRHGHQAGRAAHPHRRSRRRLRHEGLVLSGIRRACCMPRALGKSRSTGSRPARKPSSPTTRAAIHSGPSNSRSASAAASSACASTVLGNVGAYFTGVAHFVVTTHISGCLPTVYDIPHRAGELALRVHQHAADRTLSRRRPSGGELSDRARDRRRRRC